VRHVVDELTYTKAFGWLVLWPLLVLGVAVYRVSGATPWISYWAMRRLYCSTRGRSNDWLVRRLGKAPTAAVSRPQGPRLLAETEIQGALDDLSRDGFHVLPVRLSSEQCDALTELATSLPGRLIPAPDGGPADALYDATNPLATRYNLPESLVVADPVVGGLIADGSLHELARRYLRCEPVNDLVAMWWSAANGPAPSAEAAQLYHFDMDRPRFVKIFFYLTDVAVDTGPHCYVRGSHRTRPRELWRDGRHSDVQIVAAYGPEAECVITGERGKLIAVDTSGFHKGMHLQRGHRLMLQLEYASTLFGQRYERISVPTSEFWREQLAANPYYFGRFALASAPGG